MTTLPRPRGDLSAVVVVSLREGVVAPSYPPPCDHTDAVLSLWVLHELHYRGFDDVDDALEWRPDLVGLRMELEGDLERRWRERTRDLVAESLADVGRDDDLARAFFALCERDLGPSLARFVQRDADADDVAALVRQRTLYHAREQDPAMWALPRLDDETKAHLVAIAADEYGNGDPAGLHARLWADGVAAMGLDASYGAYVDDALPEVLEQNVLMTMLGLQRRLVPAALGHLAAFEVTSAVPSRRMVRGIERLGLPEPMAAYYREHMTADAVHEQLAVRRLLGGHVERHPQSLPDVFLGAAICLLAETATSEAFLASRGRAVDGRAA